MELAEKIYAAVRLIPRGKVASYSQIAAHAGSFAFGGAGVQQEKLETEGVIFVDGHVDIQRFAITPDDFEMMRAGLV